MNTYLEQFWKWSNRTFDEYARIGMNQNKGEYEDQFPLFDEMIAYARAVVDDVGTDDSDLDDLLTIMALDNEAETVLGPILQYCPSAECRCCHHSSRASLLQLVVLDPCFLYCPITADCAMEFTVKPRKTHCL